MDQPTDQIQSELENFREQWRAEVSARSKNSASSQQSQQPQRTASTQAGPSVPSKPTRRNETAHKKTASRIISHIEDEDEYIQTQSFDEPDPSKATGQKSGRQDGPSTTTTKDKDKEPQTALDFYEKAVEKETSGKLGESLQLYRKAFRMDDNVDQAYRHKHFPARWTKPAQVNPSNAPVTVPNTAHHSLEGPTLSLPDLIASFSDLRIEGMPPECEGVDAPPCPMATLPDEILVHILRDVAVADIGDFVRLAQVCKRLAYLVATEDQIWRRVCLGTEFGFGGMHFHWQLGITWDPLSPAEELGLLADTDTETDVDVTTLDETLSELKRQRQEERRATTSVLLNSLYAGSWATMFRRRPRVRFNGCYISTVNYIRAGQASVHQITWNSPVHIVTYYRYLRLFRDGSAISLLTTDEPAHVVHHVTKENLALHRGGAAPHLPSAVMVNALMGRWRLSSEGDDPEVAVKDMEGDLYVETEGVGPKYMYRMELTFKSTGAGKVKVGSNKVSWKGFWSYNRETDDWAEFALRHYKPFFFSRVRSYGFGEV